MRVISKRKKLILKKWVRVSLLLLLIFLLVSSSMLIFNSFNPKIEKTPYYNYNIKRDIDYKTYLKGNDFYEEKYLGSNKQYTAALIDYIDVHFDYLYNDSKKTDYEYTYDITATIIGEYEDSTSGKQELWTKKYPLLEEQTKKSTGTEFHVEEDLKIYYDQYDKIVNDFKKKFKLAIDAHLNVKLKIQYISSSLTTERKFENEDTLEINIPLAKSAITIQTIYDDDTHDHLVEENVKYDLVSLYFGIVLFIVSILSFTSLKNYIFVHHKTNYRKLLEKLLKDYREIIVETNTPISYKGLQIYEITNFDDMVDVEEELKSPILLYEEVEGELCQFVIIKDNNAYRYTLDINDTYE